MNWLDNAIAAVLPERGVRRFQARQALEMVRAYEAAKVGRRTEGWNAGGGTANVEIASSLSRVRNRCRQMVRDNEYASRALDGLVSLTVGTGIIAKAPDQGLWDRWMQNCDYEGQLDLNGLIELLHRGRREAGEGLIRFRSVSPDLGMEVPLQLQVLEADHLDDTKTGMLGSSGNFCICGVEFNAFGQRVAYWLYPVHPGEIASWRRNSLQSQRVPANEVLHYYRKRRASQVRGMPEFASSLLRLRDLADYEMAELVRKKIEACFVAIVHSDDPNSQLGQAVSKDGQQRQEKMSPGMIKHIPNTDSVTFGSPSYGGGYGEYTLTQLRAIAAGGGTTYELMTGDYSQQSFSGGRLQMLALRPLIEQEQWLALVPMVLNPIGRRFQQVARLAGKQKGPEVAIPWTMPRIQLGDLLKEAMGIKELIKGGLLSLPEGIRELGYDPDTVLKENEEYRKQLATAGVMVDTDPAVALKLLDPATAAKIFESVLKD